MDRAKKKKDKITRVNIDISNLNSRAFIKLFSVTYISPFFHTKNFFLEGTRHNRIRILQCYSLILLCIIHIIHNNFGVTVLILPVMWLLKIYIFLHIYFSIPIFKIDVLFYIVIVIITTCYYSSLLTLHSVLVLQLIVCLMLFTSPYVCVSLVILVVWSWFSRRFITEFRMLVSVSFVLESRYYWI